MCARFHDGPTIHDTNKVGILYGRKPMRYDERCAVLGEFGQRLLNKPFRFGIQCAGCLIEQQDGRIFEDRASKRDALALAAGQPQAAITDFGGISIGLGHDEIMGGRSLGSGDDGRIGCRKAPERDIGADCVVEQCDVLGNDGYGVAQGCERDVAHVLAVDGDATPSHIE